MWPKRLISLFIIGLVLLQVYAGVRGHARSWPFIEYRMYATAQNPGDRVERLRLYGWTVGGAAREVTPEDFGIWYWPFNNQIKPRLLDTTGRMACAAELVSLFNSRVAEPADRLRRLTVVMDYDIVRPAGRPEKGSDTLFVFESEAP